MATFKVIGHKVQAMKIVDIRPLIANGKMVGPDQALRLVLEDGKSHRWVSDSAGSIPTAGSYLVRDAAVNTDYIVSAETFAVLFLQD
jgi:hypothetical protein